MQNAALAVAIEMGGYGAWQLCKGQEGWRGYKCWRWQILEAENSCCLCLQLLLIVLSADDAAAVL